MRLSWIIWTDTVYSQGSLNMEEGINRENQRDGSVRRTQPIVAGLEDAGKGHRPTNAGGL